MNNLIVVVGPTGVGKTELTIELANWLNTDILSCDSRQLFRGMDVGTAKPTEEEQARAKHHFIDILDVNEYYSAAKYEEQAINLLEELFQTRNNVLLTGGSMLYVDGILKGIDEMPDVHPEVRERLQKQLAHEGLESLGNLLYTLDPDQHEKMDIKNPKRLLHALEVCISTGKPYSSFLTHSKKERPFNMHVIGLNRDREELYNRINKRVDIMVEDGLFEEVKSFIPYKLYQALQTVGYKEVFAHFEGEYSAEKAIELVKRNSRRYAKKQLTWFRKNEDIVWFNPEEINKVKEHLKTQLGL